MRTGETLASPERDWRMDEMTWNEYAVRTAQSAAVILPCGALEQHGPHLPLNTDALIATRIAERIALRTDSIVAPCLTYGYKSQALSGGGQIFSGTISLSGQTLSFLVRDIVYELLRHGVTRVMLINGHGENTFFLYEGIDLVLRQTTGSPAKILVVNWWDQVTDEILAELFPDGFPGWDLEHAAIIETSLMLALAGESVRHDKIQDETMERVPTYSVFPQPPDLVPKSGLLSQATPATKEIGLRLLDTIERAIFDIVAREFA